MRLIIIIILIILFLLFWYVSRTRDIEKFTQTEKLVILITGATGGIGSHVAKLLSNNPNYTIIINGRNLKKLKELKKKINQKNVFISVGDIRDYKKIINNTITGFGKIDLLFNAVVSLSGNISTDIETNLTNTWNLTYYAATRMRGGKIINFTSNIIDDYNLIKPYINIPFQDFTIYSAIKKSIPTMSKLLRKRFPKVSFITFKISRPVHSNITNQKYKNKKILVDTNSLNGGIYKLITTDVKSVNNSNYLDDASIEDVSQTYDAKPNKKIRYLIGTNPLGHSSRIKLDNLKLGEYNNNHDNLKNNIIKKNNNLFQPDNILIYSGLTDAFNSIFRSMGKNKNIIITNPTWNYIKILANKNNLNILVSDMIESAVDFNNILSIMDSETKLVYLTNPIFPYGNLVNENDFNNFINSKPVELIVLIDECYHEFARDPLQIKPNPYYLNKNVIFARSFSKFYAMPGIRLGYTIQSQHITTKLKKTKIIFPISYPVLQIATDALADVSFYRKSKKFIDGEYQRIIKFFRKHNIRFYPSNSIFILVKINNFDQLTKDLYDNHNIFIPQEHINDHHMFVISDTKTNNLILNKITKYFNN